MKQSLGIRVAPSVILWGVAAFYAYGALVHVANMASLSGFDWATAPLKWRVLDVIYLALDVFVAAGLGQRWRVSIVGFYLAASSQIALYTFGRAWILDTSSGPSLGTDATDYLDGLLLFHVVSLALVTLALCMDAAAQRTR